MAVVGESDIRARSDCGLSNVNGSSKLPSSEGRVHLDQIMLLMLRRTKEMGVFYKVVLFVISPAPVIAVV